MSSGVPTPNPPAIPASLQTICRGEPPRMCFEHTETSMPRKQKRNRWTRTDVKTIRSLAGKKSARVIGRQLKRTEGAIRQKALVLGLSLRVK